MIKLENENGTQYIIQRHERFHINRLVPGDVLILRRDPRRAMNSDYYFLLRSDAVFVMRRNGLSCPDWLLPKLVRAYKQQINARLDELCRAKYRIGDKVKVGRGKSEYTVKNLFRGRDGQLTYILHKRGHGMLRRRVAEKRLSAAAQLLRGNAV